MGKPFRAPLCRQNVTQQHKNEGQSPENLASIKKKIGAEAYHVTVERGTERPYTGKYDQHFKPGEYLCVICETKLFDSTEKFNSGCGWPAFARSEKDKIEYIVDNSHFMTRTETLCKNCGAHLGHVFNDGPREKGGQRYCINSVCLKFNPENNEKQ